MAQKEESGNGEPEIVAIGEVYAALKNLDGAAQTRVMNYVAQKLNISFEVPLTETYTSDQQSRDLPIGKTEPWAKPVAEDDLEGVSPVAKKWMTRNGLKTSQISTIFSLGVDEIDLVAKTVPGKK